MRRSPGDCRFSFVKARVCATISRSCCRPAAAGSLASSVASLQAAGARHIIVPDLPYSFPTGNSAADVTQHTDRLFYSQALWNSLAANGVNFIPADQNAMRLAIASNPALFGLQFIGTGPGQSACTIPAGVTTAWGRCSAPATPPRRRIL